MTRAEGPNSGGRYGSGFNDVQPVPLSGRYEGRQSYPIGGKSLLDIRIDIDEICDTSPVLNRISGDFFQTRPEVNGQVLSDTTRYYIYINSWIIDRPVISFISTLSAEVQGKVRFWEGIQPETSIRICFYRMCENAVQQAEVIFHDVSGRISKYTCTKKSQYIRDIELELDITRSANKDPLLPLYDTSWDPKIPRGLPKRVLTVEQCYRDAGLSLCVNSANQIIDDSLSEFTSWDDDELFDAMETYYSQFKLKVPAWNIWCFLCGRYTKENVLGMMFDADTRFDMAGNNPRRRGLAIFRNVPIYKNLKPGNPDTLDQSRLMRQFLRTSIHEIGHAFNLRHSWKRGNPSSLSWMNYPANFPYGPGDPNNDEDQYWNNFRFRFDDEELIHLRHGNRSSVIMGGELWSSDDRRGEIFSFPVVLEGSPCVEFLLRSKDCFDYMEPIEIELRLRNMTDSPIQLDTFLNPEFGRILLLIHGPNNSTVQYSPIIGKELSSNFSVLKPVDQDIKGSDRYSENIVITYGKDGFYFRQPGEYLIQAIYEGFENVTVPSNVLRFLIRPSKSSEQDSMAYGFFTFQVGMNLYLKGSQSPFLSRGKYELEKVLGLSMDNSLNAKIAYVLSSCENKPFFKILNNKIIQTHKPDPKRVLEITEPAKNFYLKAKQKSYNIPYRNIIYNRVTALKELKKTKEAKEELMDLYNNLIDVNMTTLKQIENQRKSIAERIRI